MKKMRAFPYHVWLVIFSLVGLVATFWQTAEKIHGIKNPDLALSCNINPIVDCGAVLGNSLSSLFGVPNSMIGMVIFSALFVIGLLLWSGIKLVPRGQILLLGLVAVLGAFSVWFFLVSLYIIGKICIFCIFIWISAIPLFVLTLAEHGAPIIGKRRVTFFSNNAVRLIAVFYAVGVLLFLMQFRDYYFS